MGFQIVVESCVLPKRHKIGLRTNHKYCLKDFWRTLQNLQFESFAIQLDKMDLIDSVVLTPLIQNNTRHLYLWSIKVIVPGFFLQKRAEALQTFIVGINSMI